MTDIRRASFLTGKVNIMNVLYWNPEFKEKLEIFEKLEKSDPSEMADQINKYLHPFKITDIIRLSKDFSSREERDMVLLKRAFLKIANHESKGVESLIYQVFAKSHILIDDIDVLNLFYTKLHKYDKYFIVINDKFKFPYLYIKCKYTHSDITDEFLKNIKDSTINEKIFYFLIFGKYFQKSVLLEFFEELDNCSVVDAYLNYQTEIIKNLPEKEYYDMLGTLLLYSDPLKAIKILKLLEIKNVKLIKKMLKECFSTNVLMGKVFLHFLKLLEILKLNMKTKKLILYAWLRYFLYEKLFTDFIDLLKKLKQVRNVDSEFKFYLQFEKYILNNTDLHSLKRLSKKLKENNEFARHKLKKIITKYIK